MIKMKSILTNNIALIRLGRCSCIRRISKSIYQQSIPGTSHSLASGNEIFVFIVLQMVSITSQVLIFRFVSTNALKANKRNITTRITTVTVLFSQLALFTIVAAITIQIILYQSYDLILLTATLWISYLLSITMLIILAYRFFMWLRFQKSMLMTSYGIASVMLVLNLTLTLILVHNLLLGQPAVQRQVLGSELMSFNTQSTVVDIFNILTIVSFISIWFATVLILRHYSANIGITKFWVITLMPLVYFVVQFQPVLFDVFSQYTSLDSATAIIVYSVLLIASKPLGGILFGVAFFMIGRRVANRNLRRDIYISGCGILLLFSSNQALFISIHLIPHLGFFRLQL